MNDNCEIESIEEVLDRVEDAVEDNQHVLVADIVDRIGEGAFPPLMLVPALFMISPATAVLGVATMCAIMIAIMAFQMAIGRETLWLPDVILKRRLPSRHVEKGIGFLIRPARTVDSVIRPRLSSIVEPPVDRIWATLCLGLCFLIPVLELVPLSATIIAAAISLFCLAMLARDGLLAILGLIALGGAFWLVWNVAT
jgi:hypothetical protein